MSVSGEAGLRERIVISGAGVICAVGAGLEDFGRNLYAGKVAVSPSSIVDFGNGATPLTAEVKDFDAQQWLGKGIRALDRSARLLCVAGQMALEAVGRTPMSEEGDPELGLVCGTIFGSVHSITSFDWSGVKDGVKYVNPMAFPNTVINSPAGQAGIKHRLRGVNSTISAGLASGLYAVNYAADFLRFGRARMLLAGGVEEVAEESCLGFLKNGLVSPGGTPRPFAEDRDGVVLGEGSALLVMEPAETASGKPLAEFHSFGAAHDAHSINRYRPAAGAAVEALSQALELGGLGPESVGFIVSGASGSRGGDHMELDALRTVFGSRLREIPICAPKASFGEALGASGALTSLVAVLALVRGEIPPTPGSEQAPSDLRLAREPQPIRGEFGLVTAFSCDGNNAALILRSGH